MAFTLLTAAVTGCSGNAMIKDTSSPTSNPEVTNSSASEPETTDASIVDTFGTLNPIDINNVDSNAQNSGAFKMDYFDAPYEPNSNRFRLYKFDDAKSFNAEIAYILGSADGSSSSSKVTDSSSSTSNADVAKFTAEYFEEYFVIVFKASLSSGSYSLTLTSVKTPDNESIQINLETVIPEGMVTMDMKSGVAVISLSRDAFNLNLPLEIYLDEKLIESPSVETK